MDAFDRPYNWSPWLGLPQWQWQIELLFCHRVTSSISHATKLDTFLGGAAAFINCVTFEGW